MIIKQRKISLNNEICSSNRYYYSYFRITLNERINLDSLYAACANENLDIVHILLNKGISPYNMRPTGITTGVPTLFGPTVFDHPLIYKNMKLLKKIIEKNYNLRFYDLPHNLDLVTNTQANYVKQKIRDMRK